MNETEQDRQRILVVDDDPAITDLLVALLRDRYDVEKAGDGETAIAAVADPRRPSPDLVLLDVVMPGMDGFETCRRIRLQGGPNLPVIFITGLDEPEQVMQGFEAGGVDYVTKPFYGAALDARVAVHLAIRRANAALARANKTLHEELSWAGELQRQLLSIELPDTDRASFSVTYEPLPDLHCGGDYYDVFTLAPGRYLVLLGDVSGHGLRAAFLTVMLKSIIYRGWVRNHRESFEMPAFFAWLNDRLCKELERIPGVFVAFLAFSLDLDQNKAAFCNAGQHSPLILRDGGTITITGRGIPLGVQRGCSWQAEELSLLPGDRIVAFTDGLVEVGDGSLGKAIPEVALACIGNPRYTDSLIAEVRRRAGVDSFADDVTVVSAMVGSDGSRLGR